MTTRYRLTLDIELSPNGDTDDAILFRLKQVAAYGLSNGTIIGDGPAEVVSHEVKVEKLFSLFSIVNPANSSKPRNNC